MTRRAFRPAAPDPLEGRLAPANMSVLGHSAAMMHQNLAKVPTGTTVYASNADSPAALAANAARVAHAKAVAKANSHSSSFNWKHIGDQAKHIGDQVTSFLGFHHKPKPHPAAKASTQAKTLFRN